MWNPWKRVKELELQRDMTVADLHQIRGELNDAYDDLAKEAVRSMKKIDALTVIAGMEKPGSSVVAKRMAAVAREALAE